MDDIEDNKTSLYVGNLDRRCTEQFIKDIFSKCGKVVRCKMINASSSTDPYCFVEFETKEAAEHALFAMNNRNVFDKNIKVNWATSNTGGMRKDTSNHYHIFVGDLDSEIQNEYLFKTFAAFGQVTDCRVVKDSGSGKSKGYGFVSFLRKEDAEKAMREMKGQQLKGRNIRTNWAARKASPQATKQLSRDEIARQASQYNTTVYVGNLPPCCNDDTLRQTFSQFGQVYDIKIFPEKFYGFIKFCSHDQALEAIYQSQKTVLGDNLLKCSWGKENAEMNSMQKYAAMAAVLSTVLPTVLWSAAYATAVGSCLSKGMFRTLKQQQQQQHQLSMSIYQHQGFGKPADASCSSNYAGIPCSNGGSFVDWPASSHADSTDDGHDRSSRGSRSCQCNFLRHAAGCRLPNTVVTPQDCTGET
ncbi:Nucleolysin TIA-1 isoform [Desmophyllum pertusum]|uniref:Nucleolysin TIA-1 isoform n=1 Tax=Desmophyllum pertusum TaxID=174260 RepID=A0A9W9YDN1_9CNID|nr:Nucleolysin TIA-1 isoform [Desmophyllum pertusum]